MSTESPDSYRTKYLDLLDEMDRKEKEWTEAADRLRRILAHLLIVSEGPGSAEISSEIASLRDDLKGGLDLATIEEKVDALKERVIRESKWADAAVDHPPLHQVLIHLVERLPLPAEMAQDALGLVESLEQGLAPHGLPEAIESIAGLVYRVRVRMQEERRDLEGLLREVTGRLQELEGMVTTVHDHAEEAHRSNQSLDDAVRAEFQMLEANSQEAVDLGGLKQAVRDTLESIRENLEARRQEEDVREGALRRELEKMRLTIETLESEVIEYREKTREAREMSLRDALTGCYNRLAYEERAQAEEARWQRYGASLSLVVFDVDRFKSINDTFGHRAGDQVLKAIAQIAGNQLRQVDFFARYGGEEFVALLPETDLDSAVVVAEKVRSAVEGFRFHSRGRRIPITLSAGLTQLREGDSVAIAFERSDRALYLAKERGRNRCLTDQELG